MGRTKKPNNLKFLEGDRSKRGVQKNIAAPENVPEPPEEFHPASLAVWNRIVPALIDAGRVEAVDADSLAMYCDAVRIEAELAEKLEDEGYTTVSAQGAVIAHPLTLIQNRYAKLALTLGDRFGLNTKSREAMAPPLPKQDDEDLKLLGAG